MPPRQWYGTMRKEQLRGPQQHRMRAVARRDRPKSRAQGLLIPRAESARRAPNGACCGADRARYGSPFSAKVVCGLPNAQVQLQGSQQLRAERASIIALSAVTH